MKVFLGTDHAGFELKEVVKKHLVDKGVEVIDCGAESFNIDDDYPDFVAKTARKVATEGESFGIVFGKSGAGEAIVANKIKGIRAILGVTEENVKLAREHNDANILSLGSALVDSEKAQKLVDVFLATSFSGEERHTRRIEKIQRLENQLTENREPKTEN